MTEKTKNVKEMLKKLWDDIVWQIYFKPKDMYYDIKWYFKNLISFQKQIRDWRPWDYSYQIDLFIFGMEKLRDSINNGREVDITRTKKVNAINNLINELKRNIDDEAYCSVFGEDWFDNFATKDRTIEDYKELSKLSQKLSNERYDKIFSLIKGQSVDEIKKLIEEYSKKPLKDKKLSEEEKEKYIKEEQYSAWEQVFDGSGIEGWWN